MKHADRGADGVGEGISSIVYTLILCTSYWLEKTA